MATQRLSDERLAEIRALPEWLRRMDATDAAEMVHDLLAEIERLKLAIELGGK